ncbi:MAG TPA: peptidoglycan DD-metalloendopeptidase family protein [Aggregatilineales bacterium]|jgi:hypothetical protein|nr:peptidoglycan DD-metalloendopeptidase family protein [Aggregatilineales bacterium]
MALKRFKIIYGPLAVRATPSLYGIRLGELPASAEIDVEANSRTDAEGFAWWKLATGSWVMEKRLDNYYIYLAEIKAPERLMFRVIEGPLSVREQPGLTSTRVGTIPVGTLLEVEPESRTELHDFVWWKHVSGFGWSAERKTDDTYILLAREGEADLPEEPPTGGQPDDDDGQVEIPGSEIAFFRVTVGPLPIYTQPRLNATRVGQFAVGEEFASVQNNKLEADGYIWRVHDRGWSTQRTVDRSHVFIERIESLTPKPPAGGGETRLKMPDGSELSVPRLFTRSPLDIARIKWIQYYGNTKFAYKIWGEGLRWYKYSQGLHGGFDYGNHELGTPIFAGMDGYILRVNRFTKTYSPNFITVTNGLFTVIYGHLGGVNSFRVGERVTPDTILGYIDAGGQNHLHLEVRARSIWIINPLLAMADSVRNPILTKYRINDEHFYRDDSWSIWQAPFDQPVLRLAGTLIGPHAQP